MGTSHLAALAVGLVVAVLMIGVARRGPAQLARAMELTLGVLLLSMWPLHQWFYLSTGTGNVDNLYPLHLCDIAALLGALALFTHHRGIGEFLYFWGLAGTLQGVITPALTLDFPSPRYFMFFIIHLGVVIAALYVVLGLRQVPRASAKWKAWLGINIYAVVVGGFNALVGSNYGFLCRKPPTASLFDALGPWPWYVVVASLLSMVIFLLLDLPFVKSRRSLR
ncbi:TIGR02206 family membrane protein [Phragmitibacter flavus]|nr:TIGR02206 family membrane protein [Phragmitibacter flavus]